jgi:hypothetical protein
VGPTIDTRERAMAERTSYASGTPSWVEPVDDVSVYSMAIKMAHA